MPPSAEMLQQLLASNEFQLIPILGLFLFVEAVAVTAEKGASGSW